MFLNTLLNLPTNASLMFTSRHVPSIELLLNHSRCLEIRVNDGDIPIFLEQQIQRKERLRTHIERETSLAAQGMSVENQDSITYHLQTFHRFLLAQLHIEAISQKHKPKDVRTPLEGLHRRLDETYAEAMERIRGKIYEDVEPNQRVLTWISFARRPLTVTEMRHAIAVDSELLQRQRTNGFTLANNPLLRYAAQNWGNHARGGVEKVLQVRILKLFAQESHMASIAQAMYAMQLEAGGQEAMVRLFSPVTQIRSYAEPDQYRMNHSPKFQASTTLMTRIWNPDELKLGPDNFTNRGIERFKL
jgi:hypothetical protein